MRVYKQSEEHRKKISDSLKGKSHSVEHNQKVSIALKGRIHTEETKKKMSIAKKGKSWEEIFGIEEANRRHEKQDGKPPWNYGLTKETSKGMKSTSEKLTGKKLSPEHKIKAVDTLKRISELPNFGHLESCNCFVCVFKRTGFHNRKGFDTWNKGKTKETEPRLLKQANAVTDWDFYREHGCLRIHYPYDDCFNSKFKKQILQLYNNRCVITGMTDDECRKKYGHGLHIHHWNYDKKEKNPFYFVPVTGPINVMANKNRSEWIELFNGIAEDRYCELMKNGIL